MGILALIRSFSRETDDRLHLAWLQQSRVASLLSHSSSGKEVALIKFRPLLGRVLYNCLAREPRLRANGNNLRLWCDILSALEVRRRLGLHGSNTAFPSLAV